MKMAVFWVAAPCSLVLAASIIRAANTSETSVNYYQTTRRKNPQDNHLLSRRRENLKSQQGKQSVLQVYATVF
jgi:hypothetical protein